MSLRHAFTNGVSSAELGRSETVTRTVLREELQAFEQHLLAALRHQGSLLPGEAASGTRNTFMIRKDSHKDSGAGSPRHGSPRHARPSARSSLAPPGSPDQPSSVTSLTSQSSHPKLIRTPKAARFRADSRPPPLEWVGSSGVLGGDDVHLLEPATASMSEDVKELAAGPRQTTFFGRFGSSLRQFCQCINNDRRFAGTTALVIFSNLVFIGIDIDYGARNWMSDPERPSNMRTADLVFFIYFMLELMIRIFADGTTVFIDLPNWLDIMLVCFQGSDLCEEYKIPVPLLHSNRGLSFLRFFRVLRMGRVIRLLRVLPFFEDLMQLMDSIAQSLKALVWVLALVLLVTYAIGVLLTSIVAECRKIQHAESFIQSKEANKVLDKYYGSVGKTMLVLYEVMSSGRSWGDVADPIQQDISPYVVVIFIVYTAFVFFAMMNVVTSYFVENTIRAVEESRGSNMGVALWDAFNFANSDEATVTPEIFYEHLDAPEMQRYLASLDMSPEACQDNHFFEMLDVDGSGELDVDELVSGCLRLRGNAKQIDLCCLSYHMGLGMDALQRSLERLEAKLLRTDKFSAGWPCHGSGEMHERLAL
eukprot:TRINITY_DN100743_c0_g1_i1.p1 TRINITY_DN100743_c0_g1~~TRINITY_DN100743_c0_g1_i1.p1  ORF type:complete len:591 (-),score=55.99 TRINITY_DN100743_c0_g1_i1:139-1911(-)